MAKTLLEQLRNMTTVVADTGDFKSLLSFRPQDSTTNPSLIAAAAQMPEYGALVDDVLQQAKSELGEKSTDKDVATLAFQRLAVAFGKEILAIIPGRVSTEVDARLSFDRDATKQQAYQIIQQYEAAGVSRNRVLIKIASTWEGIQAARDLETESIHCNLTLLFGLHQAAACAEAHVTLISPFVGRILDWYRKNTGRDYSGSDDPGVRSVTAIYNYIHKFGYQTSVMGASFRNLGEITELAGCDLLTISPKLLAELDSTEGELPRMLSPEKARAWPTQRLPMSQEAFERMHREDRMAHEKLTEGIEGFSSALRELEMLLANRLSALGVNTHPELATTPL